MKNITIIFLLVLVLVLATAVKASRSKVEYNEHAIQGLKDMLHHSQEQTARALDLTQECVNILETR